MRFLIATEDYAGLGLAIRLQQEGHEAVLAIASNLSALDAERCSRSMKVGEGLIEKRTLAVLLEARDEYRDAYWIWDINHSTAENEILRKEGFRVLGGGRHAYTMEHDRKACLDFVGRFGLEAPASYRFTSFEDAVRFCEDNCDIAYVYKPDEGENFETFLPEAEDAADANVEMRAYLRSLAKDASGSTVFLLQERKEGVETNVEVWFERGNPVFAFMGLECKRRHVFDLGELTGCALDYTFVIPLESRAVAVSIGKVFPAYLDMGYTGFADANFVAGKDGIWFLEKCERFGYNSHPNLFWNLAQAGLGETLASLIDSRFQGRFAEGFGASVTMSMKADLTPGKPVTFPAKIANDLYFYDVYRENDAYYTAGFDSNGDILLVNGHGYTMASAWETVMKKAAEVRFPLRFYRTDGDRSDFSSSPIRRYEALKAMGYF